MAFHGLVPEKEIFIGAAPAMMDTHRVVCRNWAVDERPTFLTLMQLAHLVKGTALRPKFQDLSLLLGKIDVGWNFFKCHRSSCERLL